MNKAPFFFLPAVLVMTAALSGCELVDTTDTHERFVEGVSFTELFREPSNVEISEVEADWAARSAASVDPEIHVLDRVRVAGKQATLLIVSHTVGGIVHFGAIISPDSGGPGSRPVIVYAHGGDGGVQLDTEVFPALGFLGELADDFVYVVPSFRSEPLKYESDTWISGGDPSPWDYDVDDALSLLTVTDAFSPTADVSRVTVLGLSRGAGVGLLMAIRDPRIVQVIEFFGPTDFFGPFAQDVVEEALKGSLRDLPGLAYLNTAFIQPLKNGSVSIADVRSELIRRSAVLFANRIPDLQIHHGTADQTVPVSQAQSLVSAMQQAGRTAPSFEFYIYEGGGHNPFTLTQSFDRSLEALSRLLN